MRVLVLSWLMMVASAAAAPPQPTLEGRAIVFVVDRGLNPASVEVVRQAVKGARYRVHDRIGVVAFGTTAQVIVPLTGGRSRAVVSTIEPTNLVAGLEAAHAMLRRSRQARLVIVVTDRQDTTGVEAALATLRADNITVSAVGVDATNERALATIAAAGHGRSYPSADSPGVAIAIQKEIDRPPPGEETVAEVLLIDRSLHGAPLELAKEAARRRADALSPNDRIAVIAFDTAATVLLRPLRAANQMRISHDISRVSSGSTAASDTGLQAAFDILKAIDATDKRVVLFGTGRGASLDLVKQMAASGIRISVSAVRMREADRDALEALVEAGRGRLQTLTDFDMR